MHNYRVYITVHFNDDTRPVTEFFDVKADTLDLAEWVPDTGPLWNKYHANAESLTFITRPVVNV